MNTISLVRCNNYDPSVVEFSVRRGIELLGGMKRFVPAKCRVLVKPNLLMSKGPESGITTHPEVVRSLIRILKEQGCTVTVGDGPSVWGKYIEDVDAVYDATGIRAVCAAEGVNLVKFEHRRWRGQFPMTTVLDEVDAVVNVPKFKTHDLTFLTGAVKNLYGLVSGTFKTELHKKYYDRNEFAKILVDIYQQVKPAFTLIDGITALEGDGPATGGRPKQLGLLLAGGDCVALDSVMAAIMGVKPHEVPSIKEAAARGEGESRLEKLVFVGDKLEEWLGKPYLLPSTSLSTSWKKMLPRPVVELAKKLIRYYPYVLHKNCIKCGACIDSCPKQVISFDGRKRITFDYPGCIACFCCQEACPASAVKVGKSAFARLIGL